MNTEESDLQMQIVDLLSIYATSRRFVFCAIPNELMGKARSGAGLAKMYRFKKMGLRKGASDLIITRLGRSHYLEMKKPGGVLSQDQKDFRDEVINAGAEYAVAHNLDEAVDALKIWGIIP